MAVSIRMSSAWIEEPNTIWDVIKVNPVLLKHTAFQLLLGGKVRIRVWSAMPTEEDFGKGAKYIAISKCNGNYVELAAPTEENREDMLYHEEAAEMMEKAFA